MLFTGVEFEKRRYTKLIQYFISKKHYEITNDQLPNLPDTNCAMLKLQTRDFT